MAKYLFQLRRGTRYVDNNGATLLDEDGNPVRDDWGTYTAQENQLNPLDGELVVEFEYCPTTGKTTPRFKLGYAVRYNLIILCFFSRFCFRIIFFACKKNNNENNRRYHSHSRYNKSNKLFLILNVYVFSHF